MTDQKIIEAMANFDTSRQENERIVCNGVDYNGVRHTVIVECEVSQYTTDHNAVQRVAEKLNVIDLNDVEYRLYQILGRPEALLATPRQKCEAILKAKGLWEES